MASYEQAIEALRRADAAGNVEDARRLARVAATLRGDRFAADGSLIVEVRPEEKGAVERFGRGANVGIAETLGAPVDIVNAGLNLVGLGSDEPIGGSASIRRGMNAASKAIFGTEIAPEPGEEDPDSLAGSMGRMTGSAASALLPIGPAAKAATAVRTAARAAPSTVRGRIVQDIAQTAIEGPGRFVAGETAAALGAGAAGHEVQQRFPDSPGAKALAELAGGMTVSGIGAALPKIGKAAVRTAAGMGVSTVSGVPFVGPMILKFGRQMRESLTPRGAMRRAQDRLKRATPDPEAAIRAGREADLLPNAPLTPIQRSGDPGLLALETSIMESTPTLARKRQEQFAAVNKAIRDSMRGTAGQNAASPDQARAYLQGLLDTRLQMAAAKADQRIAALGSRATREDANAAARIEIEKALIAARRQERQLWDSVPKDMTASAAGTRELFAEMIGTTPAAQQDDIPAIARTLLAGKKPKIGDVSSVREMQGLRSRLLEDARKARAAGEFNKARIADELAEAILKDLGAAQGAAEGTVGERLRAALDFSRDLNDRFTRGPVGRLLGFEREGGASVPAGLTLETTAGREGAAAREEVDALLRAMERSGDTGAMRAHIESFLRDSFRRAAVRPGEAGLRIDPRAAETFLRDRQDVLARFPELRREFQAAAQSGQAVKRAERGLDPKVSRAAIYLGAPPGREIDKVLTSRDPRGAMRALVRMAQTDPDGRAVGGLKAAFVEHLLGRASTRQADAADEPFVSGLKLRQAMNDRNVQSAMAALFTADERKRLATIRNTALRLDRARASAGADEGIIGDAPGIAVALLGRIGGAQLGRFIAGRTGGGTVQTPGIVAGTVRRALESGVRDPAARLLTDMVENGELFRALAMPGGGERRAAMVRRAMNAWLAGVLGESAVDAEPDDAVQDAEGAMP